MGYPQGTRGFCTNALGASSVDELVGNVFPVCQRILEAHHGDWALDLHLDRDVLSEIENPEQFEVLGKALRARNLKVASLNLYPLCRFQEGVVKERVYVPDWFDPLRKELTLRGARWLARFGHGKTLTISTLAGRFHPSERPVKEEVAALAAIYTDMNAELASLSTPARCLVLAPEPEPFTSLETSEDVRALWECMAPLARAHLGICLDTCHFSVMGQDPLVAFIQLQNMGVSVVKIQASSALMASRPSRPGIRKNLAEMAEPRFLHQASLLGPLGRRHYADLPLALDAIQESDDELACHFHMPLFLESLGVEGLGTSSLATRNLLSTLSRNPKAPPVFAETYTWSVLGQRFAKSPEEGLSRELDWLASI